MRKTNIASSGFTAVQVGRIIPEGSKDQPRVIPPGDKDETQPKRPAAKGKAVNVRSGNAKVGKQADVIVGDLHIRM